MKFNILPGRGVFRNWVYKYTYDGKIYKKLIIYTAPDCTSSVFVFDDCTGPLSSSFNQCSFPLPLIARNPDSPIFQKTPNFQKSRIAKFIRNPESPNPLEIQNRQIYQKSGVVKSTRNPESSNQPELLNQWLISMALL